MRNKDGYVSAIEQVMLKNGYYATLKFIYRNIWDYKDKSKIYGTTPEATIREKLQRNPKIFKRIGVGVYALREHLGKLPKSDKPKTKEEKTTSKHSKAQGMLLEIGNERNDVQDTYTDHKSYVFNGKTLGGLATIDKVPKFTYEKIMKTVGRCDVVYFNNRGFPFCIFEVEHSGNFQKALTNFLDMLDFKIKFYCIAPKKYEEKFEKEINRNSFIYLRSPEKCVEFLDYEKIEEQYEGLDSQYIA